MFELHQQLATVRSYNARAEEHGAEEVPAADMRLAVTVANHALSHFGSQLRDSLYWATEPGGEASGQLDLGEAITDKPYLRNPLLEGPFAIKWEGIGYELVVDYGLGKRSAIRLAECTVKDVKVLPKEGGSVELTFRVSKSGIGEKEAGKLSRMIKNEITIDLNPPSDEQRPIPSAGEDV